MTEKSTTVNKANTILAIPCVVFSRVVGYYSAVDGWNKGKKQEFKERETYNQHGRTDRNDTE